MSATLQSRIRGGLGATASLLAIAGGMTVMNEGLRRQVERLVAGDGASPELRSSAQRLASAAGVALDALRDQSVDLAPLTIFALSAIVLLLILIRT
ncbi:MAG: hypothetical protein AB7N65_14625 [Vicinamibacterales bacterium]